MMSSGETAMRIRISDRAKGVLVVVGLSASVLVATGALARLALSDFGDDDRPDPELGRPVAGVDGPVLVPIIDVSPFDAPPPSVGSSSRAAKEKDRAKNRAAGKKAKGRDRAGEGANGHGSGNGKDTPPGTGDGNGPGSSGGAPGGDGPGPAGKAKSEGRKSG
jgi:hypothetical protein